MVATKVAKENKAEKQKSKELKLTTENLILIRKPPLYSILSILLPPTRLCSSDDRTLLLQAEFSSSVTILVIIRLILPLPPLHLNALASSQAVTAINVMLSVGSGKYFN